MEKKKAKKTFIPRLIIVALSIVMLFTGTLISYAFSVYRVPLLTDSDLEERGISNASKLMIVAHPDDDMLWGGAHLMEKGYFVVVVTNRYNAKRKQEFYKVLEASGNNGIMLSYPDKTYGKKDSWDHNKDGIRRDLDKIINYQHWDLIVTHNKDGEYGHIHHKMTHRFVTDIFDENREKLATELYFFGTYHEKYKIGSVEGAMPRITDEQLAFKEEMLKLYRSQSKTIDMFCHMNPFENWQLYDGTNG